MTTDLDVLVSGMCSAVREPMSVDALVGYIRSDEYSAELALQHALIALNDSQQQRRAEFEYKVETVILNDKPDTKRIEDLAREGWELISVVGGQMTSSYCARVATSFFYKRAL